MQAALIDPDMQYFSRFVHTYQCAGGNVYNISEPIEPLFSLLRDPNSWDCPRDTYVSVAALSKVRSVMCSNHGTFHDVRITAHTQDDVRIRTHRQCTVCAVSR